MATMAGNTVATSANGGWRAYAVYSITTTATKTTLNITELGQTIARSGYNFIVTSDSATTTVTVNGSSRSDSWRYYGTDEQTTGRERSYLCTTTSLDTPRTWSIDFSRAHAQQTKTVSVSSKFNSGWAIDDKSIANTTSSGSISVTVPALDTYTVTLDSNGGTGAPATLTKWHGEALALPQPSKEYYEFSHWTDGTSNYTTTLPSNVNEAVTLTAVWTPAISAAYITQVFAERDDGRFLWDSNTGTHTSASDDGEYVYIRAWWRVDGADAATVTLGATMADDSSTVWTGTSQQVSKPGTGELYLEGVAEWGTSQTALVAGQYDVTVTLSTGAGNPSDSRGTTVSTAFFTIDVKAGGHGIAFGKPSTQNIFDVGMETNFDHDVRVMGTPLVPIGTILDFAAATAPTGYLVCDGSAVPRTTYAALFAVIGTTWGSGDGSTTFNVPDFRGRTAIGSGTGTGGNATAHALASKGGDEKMQSHSHDASATTGWAFLGYKPESGVTGGYNLQAHSSGSNRYAIASTNSSGAFTNWSATQSTGSGGSGNMQPFATVTKIIRAI